MAVKGKCEICDTDVEVGVNATWGSSARELIEQAGKSVVSGIACDKCANIARDNTPQHTVWFPHETEMYILGDILITREEAFSEDGWKEKWLSAGELI